MTYAHLHGRVTKLETRVTDIEDSHGDTLLGMRKDIRGLKIGQGRLFDGIGLIMEHLGVEQRLIDQVRMPTEDEIDAAFDEENS